MLTFHSVESRRMALVMALVSLAALLIATGLSLAAISYANRTVNAAYAGIAGVVAQKYPLAEGEIISAIRNPDSASRSLGAQILSRYDLGNMSFNENGIAAALARTILPAGLLFGLGISAAFSFLILRYQRSVNTQVSALAGYLQRIEQGDYDLDIRDNVEGSFSLLKNDLYKITVRLREQAEGLRQDKQLLSGAIADISHQVKTPLTALFVLTDLLAADPPQSNRIAFLSQVRSQLERIQWLVAALLKLARLDAGAAELKHEPVNLKHLVERAVEPLRIPLEVHNVQLVLHGDPQATFAGDAYWSAEALTNIFKNCLEHTPSGGKIDVNFSANTLYSEIDIADNGEGIASEDLPHIFTRFYRGKNASENSIGIGLALAQAIFQAQDGDIAVSSRLGEGTRFTIKIFRGEV